LRQYKTQQDNGLHKTKFTNSLLRSSKQHYLIEESKSTGTLQFKKEKK